MWRSAVWVSTEAPFLSTLKASRGSSAFRFGIRSQFGIVQSAQVISDRETGRSKGFGFVEMDTDAQAQAAIQGLHDQDHDGRRLTVDEAKPRVARTSGFAGGSIDGSGRTGGGGGYGDGGGRRY